MIVTSLEPVGARITDIVLSTVDSSDADALRSLLADHGVLVFPDQHLDDAHFVVFLQHFGELTFTTGETPVPGFDDLNVVTNVGRSTPPRSTFHTDTSYVRVPPTYTALRAVVVPDRGGDTLFSDQYRALDTLPAHLCEHIAGRSITHTVTGLDLDDDAETSAVHPIVRRHPISERPALFLSAVDRCRSIDGLDDTETQELVQELFDHSTAVPNVMRHEWSPGDVVMWDNGCVMHRADHSDVVGDRVMHRGTVGGTDRSITSEVNHGW